MAIARPIPLPLPVTIAVFPANELLNAIFKTPFDNHLNNVSLRNAVNILRERIPNDG